MAGGKSSRMGYDKGLAIVEGKKMIELVVALLKQVCDDLLIVANNSVYADLGLPVHKDIYPDKGPAGGIYTGHYHSATTKNLVMACDMPFVSVEMLLLLLKNSTDKEIVAPVVNEGMEPLCGFYNREILDKLKSLIEGRPVPAHTVVTSFNHTLLPVAISTLGHKHVFTNINKPEDLENIG